MTRSRFLLALNKIGQEVLKAHTTQEIFAQAGKGIRGLGYHCFIWEVGETGESLTLVYHSLDQARLRQLEAELGLQALMYSFRPKAGGMYRKLLSEPHDPARFDLAGLIEETLAGIDRRALARTLGLIGARRAVCAPIRAHGRPACLLVATRPRLAKLDLTAIGVFANQLTIALENAALIRDLRGLHAELGQRVVERSAELAAERNLLRTLIDGIPDFISFRDKKSRFIINNKAHLKQLGVETQAEATGRTNFDFYPRELAEQFLANDESVLRSGDPVFIAQELVRNRQGTEKWLSTIKVPIRDARGNVIGIAGISRDVTGQVRAQEELRSMARFPGENPNPVLRVERDGSILYANSAGSGLLAEWKTRAGDKVPEEILALISARWEQGKPFEKEVNAAGKAYNLNFVPIIESGYINIYASDTTEKKILNEKFQQIQKMEAIGRLAGGIAHDFNNLMTVVLGYSDDLLHRVQGDALAVREVEEINRAGTRAAALTKQLLAFSREQVINKKRVDMAGLVAGIGGMLQRLIGEDIQLEIAAAPDTAAVDADPVRIEQVLLNLVINARDAMPGGGRLVIETANAALDEADQAGMVGVQPGKYVRITVTDTGIGMDEATRERIFEPFFTTKADGKGTGLGLATVYGIVKQSGGNIWVYSELGRGSTFKVYLPASDAAAQTLQLESARTEEAKGGSETILVVEDEESLLVLIRLALEDKGYTVLFARNGSEALSLFRDRKEGIDLLISDMVLPGMSGKNLVRELAALHPETHVILMSGYTAQAILDSDGLGAGVEFLQKPFSMDALTRRARAVLDGPGQGP